MAGKVWASWVMGMMGKKSCEIATAAQDEHKYLQNKDKEKTIKSDIVISLCLLQITLEK